MTEKNAPTPVKTVLVASDHAGLELKNHLASFLEKHGYDVLDLGTGNNDSVDYPDYAHKAAACILDGKADAGVVICGTGIGISIAANRHKGIRCALCHNAEIARLARQHNNANLLALAGRFITPAEAEPVVTAFLETGFEGGRHENRILKIDNPV